LFLTVSAKYHENVGFRKVGSMKWDDQYKPKGWNSEKYDSPDIILMEITQ